MSVTSVINGPTHLDIAAHRPRFAALPVGSFEQHGAHLPVTTDTLVANAVAQRLCAAHQGLLLPAIGVSCSHEHAGFAGTLSISSRTLARLVQETVEAASAQGIAWVVIVNAHGGNYVLAHVAQELNVARPRVLLALARHHWQAAAAQAGIQTSLSDDMHGGEIETSILLHCHPELVRRELIQDFAAPERPLLTLLGLRHYAPAGIVGRPSLATAEKGQRLLEALVEAIARDIAAVVPAG